MGHPGAEDRADEHGAREDDRLRRQVRRARRPGCGPVGRGDRRDGRARRRSEQRARDRDHEGRQARRGARQAGRQAEARGARRRRRDQGRRGRRQVARRLRAVRLDREPGHAFDGRGIQGAGQRGIERAGLADARRARLRPVGSRRYEEEARQDQRGAEGRRGAPVLQRPLTARLPERLAAHAIHGARRARGRRLGSVCGRRGRSDGAGPDRRRQPQDEDRRDRRRDAQARREHARLEAGAGRGGLCPALRPGGRQADEQLVR